MPSKSDLMDRLKKKKTAASEPEKEKENTDEEINDDDLDEEEQEGETSEEEQEGETSEEEPEQTKAPSSFEKDVSMLHNNGVFRVNVLAHLHAINLNLERIASALEGIVDGEKDEN